MFFSRQSHRPLMDTDRPTDILMNTAVYTGCVMAPVLFVLYVRKGSPLTTMIVC